MRQENNQWLGWKRMTQNMSLATEDKMAAGAFGYARDYGGDGPFNDKSFTRKIKIL